MTPKPTSKEPDGTPAAASDPAAKTNVPAANTPTDPLDAMLDGWRLDPAAIRQRLTLELRALGAETPEDVLHRPLSDLRRALAAALTLDAQALQALAAQRRKEQ